MRMKTDILITTKEGVFKTIKNIVVIWPDSFEMFSNIPLNKSSFQ